MQSLIVNAGIEWKKKVLWSWADKIKLADLEEKKQIQGRLAFDTG